MKILQYERDWNMEDTGICKILEYERDNIVLICGILFTFVSISMLFKDY